MPYQYAQVARAPGSSPLMYGMPLTTTTADRVTRAIMGTKITPMARMVTPSPAPIVEHNGQQQGRE